MFDTEEEALVEHAGAAYMLYGGTDVECLFRVETSSSFTHHKSSIGGFNNVNDCGVNFAN